MSDKAVRAVVPLGGLTIEGFMMPDGSYRMSLTQSAECVGLAVQNASDFLRSNALKGLTGEGYTPQISEIEVEPDPNQTRGGTRIRAVPLEIVRKYWLWQAHRGNKKALALVDALMAETLERRFDAAFGVSRSESYRNELLAQRNQQLERNLTVLGEGFAMDDELRRERDYLERLLRENGIDPWGLPEG